MGFTYVTPNFEVSKLIAHYIRSKGVWHCPKNILYNIYPHKTEPVTVRAFMQRYMSGFLGTNIHTLYRMYLNAAIGRLP